MALGLALGADVPVFVYGYSSWAEGVGEKLEKISLHEQWVVVIKPECHVNTKEIFSAKNLTRNSKSIKIADFIAGQHQNDCVEVVCQRYQSVKGALVALSEFSEARLTGQGLVFLHSLIQKTQRSMHISHLKKTSGRFIWLRVK